MCLHPTGEVDASDEVLEEALGKVQTPADRARALRLRSRNNFSRKLFKEAARDTLAALSTLGIDVDSNPSSKEVDVMFDSVKNEIMNVGIENILSIPRAKDSQTDLTVQLLNDAGMRTFHCVLHNEAHITFFSRQRVLEHRNQFRGFNRPQCEFVLEG